MQGPTLMGHTCADIAKMEDSHRLLEKLKTHPEFDRIYREATLTAKEKAFADFVNAAVKGNNLHMETIPKLLRRGFNAGWDARKKAQFETAYGN